MIVFSLFFWISNSFSLPWPRFPKIEDPQEFITGNWDLELKRYFPNGFDNGKPEYYFMKSFRKNVGNEVYISIFNVTKQGSKKLLSKYEVLFLNEEKNAAKLFQVNGEEKEEILEIPSIQIEKDSTRYIRGHYNNQNFSLYLYPSNSMRLTFVDVDTKYITNIQFGRNIPEGQEPNPIQWYTILGLIGMFAIIGYMIAQPDEKPEIQQNKTEEVKETETKTEANNDIIEKKENNEIEKRKPVEKEEK